MFVKSEVMMRAWISDEKCVLLTIVTYFSRFLPER